MNRIPKLIKGKYSPGRILAVTIGGVFLAEVAAMIVIYYLDYLPYYQQVLVDGTIMTVLIFPVIYYLSFRSLILHIEERYKAEKALQASNERFAKAFHFNSAALSITGLADGRFIEVNQAFLNAFGYSRKEIIGRTSTELNIYPDPGERTHIVNVLREDGSVRNFELVAQIKNGELRNMEVSLEQIELDGEACILATLSDITERRQAENALRESEEKFRTLVEWTYEWEYWVDPRGCIVYTSPSCERITGYLPKEFVSNPSLQKHIIHPNDQKSYEEHSQLIHHVTAGISNLEYRIIARDGSEHWIDHICRPLFDPDNRYLGRRVSNRDCTEYKKAEHALELERTKLLNILDSMPDGIYIVSKEYDIEYINPVLEREFGNVGGRKCYQYFHEQTEVCDWCKNQNVFSGESVNWEWYSVKTGKTYELFDTPITNPDGSISKLEIFHDITERKQTEERQARQNQELLDLTNAERKQRQTAEALCAAAQSLTQTLRLEHVVDSLLDHINKIIPYDTASVALLEDEAHLALRAVRGNGHWTDFNAFLANQDATDSIIRELFSSRKSLLIPNMNDYPVPEIAPRAEHLQSWLVAPIVTGEKAIGVVWLGKNEPEFFAEEHAEWTEALIGQAGVAIQNAWLFAQVRANSERLQSLSHRLVDIQESERRYIARELHDEAGQSLTSLMVDLRILEKKASQPEAVIKTVAEMETTLDEVIDNLHRLAIALRPASLDQLGLVAALRQQVEMIGEKFELKVRFKDDGIKARLPANMETVLYRITQEALTNIVRHAHASRLDVVLKRRKDKLILIIEDDGIGFDPNAVKTNGHMGLLGMRERVEMIEGKLMVESAPGKGTTILVEVTYADPVINRG